MKVRDLIKNLQGCDPDAEVLSQEHLCDDIYMMNCVVEVVEGYSLVDHGVVSDLSFGTVPFRVSGYVAGPAVYIRGACDEVRVSSPNPATHPKQVEAVPLQLDHRAQPGDTHE